MLIPVYRSFWRCSHEGGRTAVQLAKHYGAEVTGVCSGKNIDLVKSLGADSVVDYTQDDFTRSGTYRIIFDTVGKSSFLKCRGALEKGGIYLTPVAGMGILLHMLFSRFDSRKAIFAATGLRKVEDKRRDMAFLRDLAEANALRSVIDRRYPLDKVVEAAAYVDTGHKTGNVVLDVIP